MRYFVIFLVLFGFVLLVVSENDAFAVCCFPYDMTHYIDPETGNLVVNGELWNDSYKGEPFGNSKYEFLFHNSTGGLVFEKELVITKEHPIRDGFVIHPGIMPLPFQIIIDDVDSDVIKQVEYVGTGRTSVQYFEWKPPDLKVQLEDFSKIATIQSKTQENTFDKWQISGTITNTHSERTQNVYVLASMYNMDHNIVGVAGYSDEDIQPITLNGHETKEFKIHAFVPQEKSVQTVRLYAESDDSSMKYDKTKPIILKPGSYEIKHGVEETPITISANVTNITRDSVDFDWIIQIKKSSKSLVAGDITKYPNSTVEFVKMIPASMPAQHSQILEYSWVPQSGGIYFYEMFLWNENKPVSFPFTGSFFYSDQILVSTNSLKEQLAAGTPLDELQCGNNLVLANKVTNANFVCVKSESKEKLVERGWAKTATVENTSGSKNTEKDTIAKLLTQNQIEYLPDKLIVTGGPVFNGDPRCGAVIDVNSTIHWFGIDSISKPQKMKLFSENPNPCKVNTDSCFCNAQIELTALTLDNLSYFGPEEEEKFANILIDYLEKENVNRTPKFLIGKFNLNYTDPSAIGYCGELWGYNTIDYFSGAIVDDQVADYGLDIELSPLCAISDDAKWWEKK